MDSPVAAPARALYSAAVAVPFAYLLLGVPAQLLNLPFGLLFTEIGVFLGLPVAFLAAGGVSSRRLAAVDAFKSAWMVVGAAIGFLNYFVWAVPLLTVAQAVLPIHFVEMFDNAQLFDGLSPPKLALVILSVSIAAPFGEEFFFRGVLLRALSQVVSPPVAIALTALVFSAFHLDPVGFLSRFQLGLCFGALAWRAKSIWPAVAAHAANNFVACGLYFISDRVGKPEALVWSHVVAVFVVGNIAMFALVRSVRRLHASEPAWEVSTVSAVPLWRALAPWLAASAVGLGVTLVLAL